jgi:hypothetical protein
MLRETTTYSRCSHLEGGTQMKLQKSLTACAATLLMAGSWVVVTAPPAAAACSGHSWRDVDTTGGHTKSGTKKPLRVGPHSSCTIDWYIAGGNPVVYHCYIRNSAGNTWTHLHFKNQSSIRGWMYDGNLSDGGSNKRC